MKILFDTSVLIAAVVQPHPMHTRTFPWLARAKKNEFEFLIASHTLAELYSTLTRLPVRPRISPQNAWRIIHENIETHAKIVNITAADYIKIIRQATLLGLAGGIIYDALIAYTAEKTSVNKLLTLNPDDFNRCWPAISNIITTP